MTGLIIKIKHRFPALWRVVERINGLIVKMRYGSLTQTASSMCPRPDASESEIFSRWAVIESAELPALSEFLTRLPTESLSHFDPHPFDLQSLTRLHSSGSLLMIGVWRGNCLIGYHFLRCFATGRCFHGLVVDPDSQGLGIGTRMWKLGAEIASKAGLDMYATISKANLASLSSCRRGCSATTASELPGGYLLIRCCPTD